MPSYKNSSLWSYIGVSVLTSLCMLGLYHWSGVGRKVVQVSRVEANESAQFANNQYTTQTGDLPQDFTYAAEKAMDAVVHIRSHQTIYRQAYDPFWEFFGNRPQIYGQKSESTGSGVIMSADGYIVTNNHVIGSADEIEVTLHDNRKFKATVVGTDPSTDLGVIKIEANHLAPIELANSDDARVGQWALAVGNPFNLSSTVTAGIVSAIGRNLEIIKDQMAIESFIQTDAAVNPGNSGGALVDLNGRLMGINTAISSPTGAYAGYAFAVPANIVKKVVDDLLKFGNVQRAFIGIASVTTMNGNIAKENKIDISEGLLINKLNQGGSAEEAGLQEGDVLVKMDGQPVKTEAKLQEMVGRHRPGDKVSIAIYRENKMIEKNIVLKNQFGTTELRTGDRNPILRDLGVEFEEFPESARQKYGIDYGVRISKLYAGKLRQTTDIKEGLVILSVNGEKVNKPDQLIQRLERNKGKEVKVEGFYPGYRNIYEYIFKP